MGQGNERSKKELVNRVTTFVPFTRLGILALYRQANIPNRVHYPNLKNWRQESKPL